MAGYGIRSFLIAQSLNQIDKAYGQNHSILDNCHVRVTFATNDERTAKRISETLGTATELRAQRTRRPPARAVARSSHGVAAGDGPAAADPGRSDAASARRIGGDGVQPAADQGEEAALLRRCQFQGARPVAACARRRALCRRAASSPRRLERPGDSAVPAAPATASADDLGGADEAARAGSRSYPRLPNTTRTDGSSQRPGAAR